MKKIYIIGIGPGSYEQMTIQAVQTLERCDTIVGYPVYIDLIKPDVVIFELAERSFADDLGAYTELSTVTFQ